MASLIAQLVKNSPAMQETPAEEVGLGRSVGEGTGYPLQYSWTFLVAELVNNLPAMQETWIQSLGLENPMEKGKATHSSILAWRIPWTEEPGRLQSTGSMHPWGHKESGTTEPPSLSLFSCYQATLVSGCTPYLVWPFSSLTRSPMSFSNADLFFTPFIDFRIAQRVGRKLLAGPAGSCLGQVFKDPYSTPPHLGCRHTDLSVL